MIRVDVSYGDGDRKASTVSDELIGTDAMAYERARHELAEHVTIVKSRKLSVAHDPTLNVGDYKDLSLAKIDLWGLNFVSQVQITISDKSIKDSVTVEQYGYMP